jgi:hypothetical protein
MTSAWVSQSPWLCTMAMHVRVVPPFDCVWTHHHQSGPPCHASHWWPPNAEEWVGTACDEILVG